MNLDRGDFVLKIGWYIEELYIVMYCFYYVLRENRSLGILIFVWWNYFVIDLVFWWISIIFSRLDKELNELLYERERERNKCIKIF